MKYVDRQMDTFYTEISLTKNTKVPKDFKTTIMQFIFSNTELCWISEQKHVPNPWQTTYAMSRSLFFTRVSMSGMDSDFDNGDFLVISNIWSFFSGVSFRGGPVRLVQSTNNMRN